MNQSPQEIAKATELILKQRNDAMTACAQWEAHAWVLHERVLELEGQLAHEYAEHADPK
jgi:hypothetical protein